MGVNLTMNLIILASLLLSFLPLIVGTDNGGEKSLQIDWDKWEKFDNSWMEYVQKKRRKKSASLRDFIHLIFHSRRRKDEEKKKERKKFGENWDEDLKNPGRKKRAPMSNSAMCCIWIFLSSMSSSWKINNRSL